MRLVSISKIRDEADILDCFIRYHLRMVDHMIIMDHRSRDGSSDILKRYEGTSVTVIQNTDPAHEQSMCLTGLLKKAITEQAADWVLPLDADEFLRTTEDVHESLATLPQHAIRYIPWQTYVPLEHRQEEEDGSLLHIAYRRDYEPDQFYKILIPCALVDENTVICEGSHNMHHAASHTLLPAEKDHRFAIAHFPVRTENQLRQKVRNACEARAKLAGHFEAGHSFHLKNLEKKLQETPALTTDDIMHIALWYAASDSANARKPDLVYDPLPAV